MVKKRLIACLDVAGGRVVKGVRFERLRDVGDPGRARRALLRGRRRRARLPRHHGERGGTEAADRARRAGRGEPDDPVHRRRRDLRARGRACAAASWGGQGGGEPRRVRRPHPADDPRGRVRLAGRRLRDRLPGRARRHSRRTRAPRSTAVDWAAVAVERGAGELLVTSIDTDGTREGYDLALTGAIATSVEVPVIASGGAGESRHLADAFAVGAEAALVASIVHERPERVPELKAELRQAGWNLRT